MHELAVIVGRDIVTSDLLPIFCEFLKDLDEVRVGVFKHLADFLKVGGVWGEEEGGEKRGWVLWGSVGCGVLRVK